MEVGLHSDTDTMRAVHDSLGWFLSGRITHASSPLLHLLYIPSTTLAYVFAFKLQPFIIIVHVHTS